MNKTQKQNKGMGDELNEVVEMRPGKGLRN